MNYQTLIPDLNKIQDTGLVSCIFEDSPKERR